MTKASLFTQKWVDKDEKIILINKLSASVGRQRNKLHFDKVFYQSAITTLKFNHKIDN